MVTTRKRGAEATPAAEAPASSRKGKKRQRHDQPSSPKALSPAIKSPGSSPPKAATAPLPKGRRGMALLAAAGVTAPVVPPSPAKAAPSPGPGKTKAAAAADVPLQVQRRFSPRRDALLRQALPKSYSALADFFAALQLNYGTLRKRGQRCTYQTLRAAVEEQTSRRFLVSHLAQLAFLLPDVLSLEWVRLPVAPYSSRTEPHLAISLGAMPERWDRPQGAPREELQQAGADAEAAAAPRALHHSAVSGNLSSLRQLLHYRLAGHLLEEYRQHLQQSAVVLRAQGKQAAAEEVLAQAAAIPSAQAAPGSPIGRGRQAQQPVAHFAAGFLKAAPEVPQLPLPRRPDQPASAAASPAALSSHLALPATPATRSTAATPATAHATTGRPPLPPATLAKRQQRRLSFGLAAAAAAAAGSSMPGAAAAEEELAPEVPGSAPSSRLPFKSTKASTPLDKLHKQIMEASPGRGLASCTPVPEGRELEPSDMEFNGRILSEDEARVWDSLPEAAKRLSLDGIMSFEAHMAVEAAARQHQVGSSKEAQEARALRNALGLLPKTFMRVQRVFGTQGPNAIKLRQVVARLRAADESFSAAEVEQHLALLAQHAPECCSLRAYGSCGTPAVWWDRQAERASNGSIYRRLKQVAEARHSLGGGEQPQAAAAAAEAMAA